MSETQFNLEKDVEKLNEIFETKNEDECIKLVAHRTNDELQKIKQGFKSKYSKDPYELIKDQFSGNFENFLIVIFDTPEESDSKSLYYAMKGFGTNKSTLIEILSSRKSEEIKKIKVKFEELYKKSLVDWIKSEISDDSLLSILFGLINEQRRTNPSKPSLKKCRELANKLALKEKLVWEKSDSDIFEIFIRAAPVEQRIIAQYFNKFKGKTIVEQINKDFSSDVSEALISILKANISPSEFFSEKIYESIKGAGTNEYKLMRNVYCRAFVDMSIVKKYYQKKYNIEMLEDIKDDISGTFFKLMAEFVNKE